MGDVPDDVNSDPLPPIPPPPGLDVGRSDIAGSPPRSPVPRSWGWEVPQSPMPPPEQPSKNRAWGGLVAAAAVMAVLMVAGLVIAVTSTGQEYRASGATFALSFTEGDRYRFHLEHALRGTMSTETGINQTFGVSIDERVSFRVVSVSADGVATADVTIDKANAQANGISYPVPRSTIRIRVAKDGRVLSSGGLTFGAEGSSSSSIFPSMDQVMPLLPDGKVQPGDRWTQNFSVPFPLGSGSLQYETSNQFLRYEALGGVRAAVIQSEILVPLKLTMDPGKFLEAAGGDLSQLPAGLDAKLKFGGNVHSVQTSWYDLGGKQALKSSAHGSMDLRLKFTGAGTGDIPEVRFLGTFDTQFETLSTD
jgi:hypothetical protein